jgi:hypothetical protein
MTLIRLKATHDEELSKLRTAQQQQQEDTEVKLTALVDKVEKLRRANKELEAAQEESSLAKIRERIDRAVHHALHEQNLLQETKVEELHRTWEGKMRGVEEAWQRKVSDLEEINQVQICVTSSVCNCHFYDLFVLF